MNILSLSKTIIGIHKEMQGWAHSAVNISLTIRNWLIGFYIVEYEQHGEDRAKYGDQVLKTLTAKVNIRGLSLTNLKLNRQFYLAYPQIGQSLTDQREFPLSQLISNTQKEKGQSLTDQFRNDIHESIGDQVFPVNDLKIAQQMLQSLSFTHITLILTISEKLKRNFYIIEAIRGVWSVRELKRQIDSLYFERSGLSTNKEKLSHLEKLNSETENVITTLRNPMVFEFLDLPITETLEESQLEKALMDNLQQFLLELGYGFCFEARQKRILIDDEYFYIDLVFYHRILKCHVLIELKSEAFNHENIGQLNVYLQYYKNKMMHSGDKPPVGILLCTKSKPQMVRYALANKDNLLINEYKLRLPSTDELQKFVESQLTNLDNKSTK